MKPWYFLTLMIFGLVACKPNAEPQVMLPSPEEEKKTVMALFEKKNAWMVDGLTDSLQTVIHGDASYGHSNCWIQSADETIFSAEKDSLVYLSIQPEETDIRLFGSTAIIRGKGYFAGLMGQDSFGLHLCFMETYSKDAGRWQLVDRQSAKIPK